MRFHITFPRAEVNQPTPKDPPGGWLVEMGDGQGPAVVLHDEFFEDRATYINQTNETQPLRPVDPNGFWRRTAARFVGFLGFDPRVVYTQDVRVSPTGKIIVQIGNGGIYAWMKWIIDIMGFRNASKFITKGNGYMDTDPLDAQIDGSTELKLMASATGGSLVNTTGSVVQGGRRYYFVEAFDYYNPPVETPGGFLIDGKQYDWDNFPYLFTCRVNRVVTKIITWLTRNGINAANGIGGDECWCLVINKPAALPADILYHYPLPNTLTIYANSIIVDGELVPQTGGKVVTIVAYKFYQSSTYGRDEDGNWWLLEEMLDPPAGPGNGFWWRVYASKDGQTPYVPYRAFRVPHVGWTRQS